MTVKELSIKTASIEIKVIRVDGHKMTKATFRQIPFDNSSVIEKCDVLGWVSDEGVVILFRALNGIRRRWARYVYSGSGYGRGYGLSGKEMEGDEADRFAHYVKQTFDQLYIAT